MSNLLTLGRRLSLKKENCSRRSVELLNTAVLKYYKEISKCVYMLTYLLNSLALLLVAFLIIIMLWTWQSSKLQWSRRVLTREQAIVVVARVSDVRDSIHASNMYWN